MRKEGKTAKKLNTAFGLILILAVVIASPIFGFGLGLATMEWKPAQAPSTMLSTPRPSTPVPEPVLTLTQEPSAVPSASPTPDYSANPLSRPVPVKIDEPTPTQSVNGEAVAVNKNNRSSAQSESTDQPEQVSGGNRGVSAPIPLKEPSSEPTPEAEPTPSPEPTPGKQGAPVPFRRDRSEGEAFTVG